MQETENLDRWRAYIRWKQDKKTVRYHFILVDIFHYFIIF